MDSWLTCPKQPNVLESTRHTTAITTMSEAGVEARKIMFMSVHRSKSSLGFYNRTLLNEQKQSVSSCLSSTTHPESEKQLTFSNVSNIVICQKQENANVPLQTSAENFPFDFHNSGSIYSLKSSEFSSISVFYVFLTSNNSFLFFNAAMRVFRENQIASPEIIHSSIFVLHF